MIGRRHGDLLVAFAILPYPRATVLIFIGILGFGLYRKDVLVKEEFDEKNASIEISLKSIMYERIAGKLEQVPYT